MKTYMSLKAYSYTKKSNYSFFRVGMLKTTKFHCFHQVRFLLSPIKLFLNSGNLATFYVNHPAFSVLKAWHLTIEVEPSPKKSEEE